MNRMWRTVLMFAWLDLVGVAINGWLAWGNRQCHDVLLFFNCLGMAFILYSVRITVQMARLAWKAGQLEKLNKQGGKDGN